MTKSKSSTIAIVVLSVLLAAALASTIVLAAFNATRTAQTTITFQSGLTLTLSSDDSNVQIGSSGNGDITVNRTNLLENTGDLIGNLKAQPNGVDAFVAFSVLPTVSGTGDDGAYAIEYTSSSGQTLTYTIKAGETEVAQLVYTLGANFTVTTEPSDTMLAKISNATALTKDTATPILQSIVLKDATGSNNAEVADVEGLTIKGLILQVGAAATVDNATVSDAEALLTTTSVSY